jgi:hypothetical protein
VGSNPTLSAIIDGNRRGPSLGLGQTSRTSRIRGSDEAK